MWTITRWQKSGFPVKLIDNSCNVLQFAQNDSERRKTSIDRTSLNANDVSQYGRGKKICCNNGAKVQAVVVVVVVVVVEAAVDI